MTLKKVLLTGFEPFGGRELNPSYEAVKRAVCDGYDVKKVCLPVTWDGAPKMLFEEIDAFDPDAVIMCGLALGSDAVRVERLGINLCGAIADNNGKYPSGDVPSERKISDGGADAYFSTFNYEKILKALKENNIPSTYSFSAGPYICNLALYSALMKNASSGAGRKMGFIHLPYVREFDGADAKSITLDTAVKAVETAVLNCF